MSIATTTTQIQSLVARRIEAAGFERPDRLNLAKTVLSKKGTNLLESVERDYRLKLYFVSSAAEARKAIWPRCASASSERRADGRKLAAGRGLRHVLGDLRGSPPAAIILLTDGVNTDGESLADAARYARRKGVPLFTVGLGSEQPLRDLELADLLVDDVVFVDDVVNFEFKLTGHGLAGKTVEVVLREKDSNVVLARMKATIGDDGKPQHLHLPYRPTEVGEFEYVVEVEHLPDEAQPDNNSQLRLVSVRKEQIKVLLVQGYPNFEFRYLKHMLERDSTIELKTVLQEADLEYAELDETALRVFPVRREELFAFDVVIFGDVNPSFLSTSVLANLNEFVEKKGGRRGVHCRPALHAAGLRRHAARTAVSASTFPPRSRPIPRNRWKRASSCGRPTWAWSARRCNLATTRPRRPASGPNLPPLYWLLEDRPSQAGRARAG